MQQIEPLQIALGPIRRAPASKQQKTDGVFARKSNAIKHMVKSLIELRKKKKPVLVPLGTHRGTFTKADIKTGTDEFGAETRELLVEVELDLQDPKGKPYKVSKSYNLLGRGAMILEADLQSWKGQPLTTEELDAFDPDTLKARPVLVEIQKYRRDGTKRVPVPKTFHPDSQPTQPQAA